MIKTLGVALAGIFLMTSVLGTIASGWLLGEALVPSRSVTLAILFAPGAVLAMLAMLAEGLRFTLSLQAERVWRKSQFRGVAFAGPLWLACTAYCILMPLLALAIVPRVPVDSPFLMIVTPAWIFVQLAAGLLPGIAWPVAASSVPADVALPRPLPERALPEKTEFPAHLVPQPASSADDFFDFLARLSKLPAGSTLPQRGRIGANREIIMSQAAMAALLGRTKPTIRRWLQDLERRERITKTPRGKDTCILLQQHPPTVNGDARNGDARV